jgi:hypothetical protein
MSHKRIKFSRFFEDCFPHHSLRIPPNPVWVKWVVPVFQVAHRRFEDCFPHHPINIPEVAPQRQMIRPVAQLAQGTKKEGESFGFSLFVAFYDLSFNFDLSYSQPRGSLQ